MDEHEVVEVLVDFHSLRIERGTSCHGLNVMIGCLHTLLFRRAYRGASIAENKGSLHNKSEKLK